MAPAPNPCPACGLPVPEGAATCPRDGTPLVASAGAPGGPPSAPAGDGSPGSLFVPLAIVGPLMFLFSGFIALWIWHRQVPPDRPQAPVNPPAAFNGALLLTRIDRLEHDLKEATEAGSGMQSAAEELKVLRIRAETAADPVDQHRVTEAVDAWEQRYLPR